MMPEPGTELLCTEKDAVKLCAPAAGLGRAAGGRDRARVLAGAGSALAAKLSSADGSQTS
jgi:hypothetical protein